MKMMIAIGGIVGLAEGIIDDTCLVILSTAVTLTMRVKIE